MLTFLVLDRSGRTLDFPQGRVSGLLFSLEREGEWSGGRGRGVGRGGRELGDGAMCGRKGREMGNGEEAEIFFNKTAEEPFVPLVHQKSSAAAVALLPRSPL